MSWDVFGKANTNLIKYSEDFSKWSLGTGATRVATTLDYYGGTTAYTISDNSTTLATGIFMSDALLFETIPSGTVICLSLHVDKDSIDKTIRVPRMRILWETNTKSATLKFDTSTGEVYSTATAGVTVDQYGVEEYDDYFRFYLSASYAGSFSRVDIIPASQNGELAGATVATTTGSMLCFGAMLNYGNMPLPYRKTDGSEISWSGQSDDSQSWSAQSKKSTTWVTA